MIKETVVAACVVASGPGAAAAADLPGLAPIDPAALRDDIETIQGDDAAGRDGPAVDAWCSLRVSDAP